MKKHVVPLPSHRSLSPLGAKDGVFSVLEKLSQGAKGSVLSALEFFLVLTSLLFIAPTLPAQDFQPQPVSEYAEKSGPNTITFLSYPKYYTDSKGQLTPVITDLVTSKSPDWDFEVVTGIWTLRVRADGTFQAEHAGNAFTYRLSQIGVGRGEAFHPFEWGEPNWKNYQVIGDKIRWYDIFPDVDLVVRYIHDILKVDVIVKSSLMSQIRAEVKKGSLNPDDYLTARFDIPNVWITTEAQLGGEKTDIYANNLDLQQPLEFVKDGKIVQRLRPVETHVLDAKGEPIISFDEENSIRSAQTWRLKKDAPGVAEMSANLGDLANAPEGDVAIDPSMVFNLGIATKDACIANLFPTSNSGNNSTVSWGIGTMSGILYDYRLVFGFNVSNATAIHSVITQATLEFYETNQYWNQNPNAQARVFKLKQSWAEDSVTWQSPWTSSYGGNFDLYKFPCQAATLPTSSGNWIRLDATQAFKSHLADATDGSAVESCGFLVQGVSTTVGSYAVAMSECATETIRPKLTVVYQGTQFGMASGFYDNSISGYTTTDRIDKIEEDNFGRCRISGEVWGSERQGPINAAVAYASAAYNRTSPKKRMQLEIVIPAGWPGDFSNATDFAGYVEDMLEALSSPVDYINNKTVVAIELGAEEDANKWTKVNGVATETGGSEYAEYYLAAWEKIKNNSSHPTWKQLRVIGGGSAVDWKHIASYNPPYYETSPSYHFLKGFLDVVTTSANIHKIPDMLGVHTYTEKYPPEGHNLVFPEIKRLFVVMLSLCKEKGFIPNFCTTEYGFGATLPPSGMENNAVPSTTANNYTQAVYYLRSRLITGCIQPVGLEQSTYYLHPRMVSDTVVAATGICDWGFHNFDGYPGTDRAARYIAQGLMNSSNGLNFGSSDVYTWLPYETYVISGNDTDTTNIAKCGFKSSQNVYWLAVWQFERHSFASVFDSVTETTRTITIPGNFYANCTSSSRKFSISTTNQSNVTIRGYSLPNQTGTASFIEHGSVTGISYNAATGLTTLTISCVNENPTFIKFIKNN